MGLRLAHLESMYQPSRLSSHFPQMLVGVEDKGMSYSPSTAFGPVCGVDDGVGQPASPGCGSSQVTHFYLLEFSSSCVLLTILNYFALCVIETTIF